MDGDADDEQVWRCKACGTRQPDPEPPCERCWNTTFVSGEGADGVVRPTAEPSPDATALRVAQAQSVASRTGAAAAVLAVPLGVLQWALSGALAGLAFTLWVGVSAVAVALFLVAAVAKVADSTGFAE